MLQLLLKTHLAFLLIPLLTLAIEPSNPTVHCERFLSESEKAACVQKVETGKIDWYASSACSLQDDDKNFLSCLDEIQNANYNPEALELCAQSHEIPDETRLQCLKKIKNKDYTRAQIKACSESQNPTIAADCLAKKVDSSSARTPASKSKNPGFQSLEVRQ